MLQSIPDRDDLTHKYYVDLFEKRDRVAISNYSIYLIIHFLKVNKLQIIMNILNEKIDFKKISTSIIAKTNNLIMSNLIDAGIDVDMINQTSLKLQRLKMRYACHLL